MNPFYNPSFILKTIKNYLYDINRLNRLTNTQLQKFQTKQLKKMVQHAYNTPMYHSLYKKAGIHPNDITHITDLSKLPVVTKQDFEKHYPNGIIPTTMKKQNLIKVSTSGTTGKSLSIFVDPSDIVMGLFGYMRTLREYNISWRKNKIAIIGDFATHTAESGYINKGLKPLKYQKLIFKNILWLNTNDKPKDVIQKLNTFQPDFIGGYVGMLGHLAVLKDQGLGKNVNPQYVASTGAVLNPYLKNLIQTVFNTHVFEVYGATETGPIAFQCKQGSYHILSDLIILEITQNNKPVKSKQAGHLIVTKLYGKGTPILRYNAIDDIISPTDKTCNCTMAGDLIHKRYGRGDLALYLPGGKVLLPSSFSEIYSKILYELKTTKLQNTRVIQKDLNHIEIEIVIDKKQQNQKPSTDKIISVLKEGFQEKVGPEINITIREVEKLPSHIQRIVSKVNPKQFETLSYL